MDVSKLASTINDEILVSIDPIIQSYPTASYYSVIEFWEANPHHFKNIRVGANKQDPDEWFMTVEAAESFVEFLQ